MNQICRSLVQDANHLAKQLTTKQPICQYISQINASNHAWLKILWPIILISVQIAKITLHVLVVNFCSRQRKETKFKSEEDLHQVLHCGMGTSCSGCWFMHCAWLHRIISCRIWFVPTSLKLRVLSVSHQWAEIGSYIHFLRPRLRRHILIIKCFKAEDSSGLVLFALHYQLSR